MSNTQVVVSGFTASAFLVDCEIVKQRKLELQSKSPADLVNIFGPCVLDESLASVPLNKLPRIVEAAEANRQGVPAGPSRNSEKFNDGSWPLVHVGHEVVAQFLATPESIREFKSVTALADHLEKSRVTVYRWMKDREVLRRARWLTGGDEMLAAIIARRELPEIAEKLAEKAKRGDVPAAKLLFRLAVELESRSLTSSGHISSLSINEAMAMTEDSGVAPSWRRELDEGQQ